MTTLILCRLTVTEAQRLALAPANAGGWVAVHPDCRQAVNASLCTYWGDGADCLAMLPAGWSEAALRPVSREQADGIAAELERIARWTDTSAHGTPPAEIASRVRVWLHEAGLSPGDAELLARGAEDVRAGRTRPLEGGDYVFPERIELDDASLAEFERAVAAEPPEPNEALRELFRGRGRDRSKP